MGYFDEVTKWKGLDQIRGPKRASEAPPSVPPPSSSAAPKQSVPPNREAEQNAPPANVHHVNAAPTLPQTPGVVMVTVPPPPSAGRFRFLAIGLLLGAIVTVVAVSPSLRGIRATLAKLLMPEDAPEERTSRSRTPETDGIPASPAVVPVQPSARAPTPLESKPLARPSTGGSKSISTSPKGPQRLPDHRSPSPTGAGERSQGGPQLPSGLEGLGLTPESAGQGFEGASKALDFK